MTRGRKLALGIGVAAVAYFVALVILSWALRGSVAERVRARVARAFDGEARVGAVSLDLVRGQAQVRDLVVTRHHRGALRLAIERLDVDLAPLGAVVVAPDPDHVRVVGAHLSIEGAGAMDLPPRPHTEVTVGGLEVVASDLELVVTTAWPELAHLRIAITRVRCGRTVFRTPLSWVFSLEELDATVELTGAAPFALRYRGGQLVAQGGIFGEAPVVVPVALPRDPGPDEPARLRSLAFDLGRRLVIARAKGWLMRRFLLGPRP